VVVELQSELRSELKEPIGTVFTDVDDLLEASGSPLIAVGDVVTAHLLDAGRVPDVAVVDARTERTAVEAWVEDAISGAAFERERQVANPAATLTADLLRALADAVTVAAGEHGARTIVDVDGEEDLATLPALVVAPTGASIVYGQPGEGMVHVTAGAETATTARELLVRMDGDTERLWALLGVE
jgi:uncharacterized protein (UPF0218 family)